MDRGEDEEDKMKSRNKDFKHKQRGKEVEQTNGGELH